MPKRIPPTQAPGTDIRGAAIGRHCADERASAARESAAKQIRLTREQADAPVGDANRTAGH
ncbi:hypothetical protein GCM10009560_44180 [Nonomuraea longicatena]|uniref:Uncharacterized protein n=1 Tax=Nonomuraea longicatena TaxID=83682 RepID=A0ABN1Q0Z6_9ACTN